MGLKEPLSVRPAEAGDVGAVRELVRQAYEVYVERMGRQPAPMTADYVRVIENGNTWIAEQGGRIVGVLVVQPAEDHLQIENVAVLPQAHGLGVGRRLLQLAEEQARTLGVREIRLYTNQSMTENLAYYPRRGYRETHRAIENGYHRVFFTKDLG